MHFSVKCWTQLIKLKKMFFRKICLLKENEFDRNKKLDVLNVKIRHERFKQFRNIDLVSK